MGRGCGGGEGMDGEGMEVWWGGEEDGGGEEGGGGGGGGGNGKISLLNTMNRKFPTSSLVTDANMEIAKTYMSDERYKDAISYLNNIIKEQDNNSQKPHAYLRLGIYYYNLNNTGEA